MALSPRMKAAIVLYVRVGGDREAFLDEARNTMSLSYAGAATFWHVLKRCPTDAQKTYLKVERAKHRGALFA